MQSKSLTTFVFLCLTLFVSASPVPPTGNVPDKDVHGVHGISETPHRRASDNHVPGVLGAPHPVPGSPHVREARGHPEPIPSSPAHTDSKSHVPRESDNNGPNVGDGYNPHPPKLPTSQAAGNHRRSQDYPGPKAQGRPGSQQPNGPSNPQKRSDDRKPDSPSHSGGQVTNGPSPHQRSDEADLPDVPKHGKHVPRINQVRGTSNHHGGKGDHETPHQRSTGNTEPNGDDGSHDGHGSPVDDGGSPVHHGREVLDVRSTGEHKPFTPGRVD